MFEKRLNLALIILLLASSNLYALACPGIGGILNTGYSVDKVLQLCGQPIKMNNYLSSTNINEEWVYFKSVFGENSRMTLSFRSGQLININVLEAPQIRHRSIVQNVSTSGFCSQMIQVGHSMDYVRSVCGSPAVQDVNSSVATSVTELMYHGAGPNVLVFNDNQLVDWKYSV